MQGNKIALIPARSGSKRIPNKNLLHLDDSGHCLMAYAIRTAIDSKLFNYVFCSSDSMDYLKIAHEYGAITIKRPFPIYDDLSPDIEWVTHALTHCDKYYTKLDDKDIYAIIRPTNPFRQIDTLYRAMAWWQLNEDLDIDSMRAMSGDVKPHPCKTWKENGGALVKPFYTDIEDATDQATQGLPHVLGQNGCLEMAYVKTARAGSTSGKKVLPFITKGYEGFDINTELDYEIAKYLIKYCGVELPKIFKPEIQTEFCDYTIKQREIIDTEEMLWKQAGRLA